MTPEQKRIKCAEILGWTEIKTRRATIAGIPVLTGAHEKNNGALLAVPNYLVDANAALELVEHMRKRGWGFACSRDVNDGVSDGDTYCVEFYLLGGPLTEKITRARKMLDCVETSARSFSQAVTDAFLKANKVEEVEVVK